MFGTSTYTPPFFPVFPYPFCMIPVNAGQNHMPIIQGTLGKVPPKGDSCIFCGNMETAVEGVGVRRAFSAKTLPKAPAEAGRLCTTSSTASTMTCFADSGLRLISISLSPGWCNHFQNISTTCPSPGRCRQRRVCTTRSLGWFSFRLWNAGCWAMINPL